MGEHCLESESESDSEDWDSENEESRDQSEGVPHPFAPKASSVVEHGILLECSTQSLKTTASLRFWIIG